MPKNKNKIPDRWEEYSGVGTFIAGTRFIAFKTPLKEQLLVNKAEELAKDQFTPKELLRRVEKDGVVLGMIIDLTYTTRYYDREFFVQEGVTHCKVETEGQKVPNSLVCKKFARIVNNFLEHNWENDLFIGVHCTHGVNRTGYMICRYMIEELNYSSSEAIRAFNVARGHRLEREEYLLDLHTMAEKIANGTWDNCFQPSQLEQHQIQGRGRPRGPYPSQEERWYDTHPIDPHNDFDSYSVPPLMRLDLGRGRGPRPPVYMPPWGMDLPPAGYGEFMYRGGAGPMGRGAGPMGRGAGPMGRGAGLMGRGMGPMRRGIRPMGRGMRPMGRGLGLMGRGAGPMRGSVGPIRRPKSFRNYTPF